MKYLREISFKKPIGMFKTGVTQKTIENPSVVTYKVQKEKDFVAKHKVQVTNDPYGNGDKLFKASNIPAAKRMPISMPPVKDTASYGSGSSHPDVKWEDTEIKVGDRIHAGLKKGWSTGYKGKVTKIEGEHYHFINDTKSAFGPRTFKAHKSVVTKEELNESDVKCEFCHKHFDHKEYFNHILEKHNKQAVAAFRKVSAHAKSGNVDDYTKASGSFVDEYLPLITKTIIDEYINSDRELGDIIDEVLREWMAVNDLPDAPGGVFGKKVNYDPTPRKAAPKSRLLKSRKKLAISHGLGTKWNNPKEETENIFETIPKGAPCSRYVDDFVHSTNSRFSGDSKKQRIKRALGACYADKRNEESLLETISNPNSSGQGYDESHRHHPLHSTVTKHGFGYSHSTPIHALDGTVHVHHTYAHGEHKVGFKAHSQEWSSKVSSASGHQHHGTGVDALDKHLKSKVKKYKLDVNIPMQSSTREETEQLDEKNWIAGAIKHPGALTRKAKKAGESPMTFARSHTGSKDKTTARQSKLAITLSKIRKKKSNR